jgi:hypothetical protein
MGNLRQSESGFVREAPERFEKPFNKECDDHRDDERDAVNEQSLVDGGFHRLGLPGFA